MTVAASIGKRESEALLALSRRDETESLDAAVSRCLDVLKSSPAGLILDIDGVLSDIAPTPDAAIVVDANREVLADLVHRLALVAVVSGRSVAAGERMVGVPDLVYVGNHGMEWSRDGVRSIHPEAAASAPSVASAIAAIASAVAGANDTDAILIENKGVTGTIHYRLARDPSAARALVLEAAVAAAEAHALVVTEGRLIVELRPNLVVNKGTAIVQLVAEHRLRGVVFFGDDVTDVDGFVALRTLREQADVATLCVGVLAAETPMRVRETMDVGIGGVAAVTDLLQRVAAELTSEAQSGNVAAPSNPPVPGK